MSRRYAVGQVSEHDLHDLWASPEYVAFRKRVQGFEFSPAPGAGAATSRRRIKRTATTTPSPPARVPLGAGMIHCP